MAASCFRDFVIVFVIPEAYGASLSRVNGSDLMTAELSISSRCEFDFNNITLKNDHVHIKFVTSVTV